MADQLSPLTKKDLHPVFRATKEGKQWKFYASPTMNEQHLLELAQICLNEAMKYYEV